MKSVYPFFGAELKNTKTDFFKALAGKSVDIIAMDSLAIGISHELGLKYSTIDDWITTSQRIEAIHLASAHEKTWFEQKRDLFTVENTCWPEIDRFALHSFWLNCFYLLTLSNNFKNTGIQAITLVDSFRNSPHFTASSSSILQTYFRQNFRVNWKYFPRTRMIELISKSHQIFFGRADRSVNLESDVDQQGEGLIEDLSGIETVGNILIALNFGELFRFQPLISQLKNSYGNKLIIVVRKGDIDEIRNISFELKVPIIKFQAKTITNRDKHVGKFNYAFTETIKSSDGVQNEVFHAFNFYFDYLSKVRWPGLVNDLASWSTLIEKYSPDLVFISSLDEAESQLSGLAAKQQGIPTVALPHGGLQIRGGAIYSDYSLCEHGVQERIWIRSGIAGGSIIKCDGLIPEDEYPTEDNRPYWEYGVLRVLVLTNPIGFDNCVAPLIDPRKQLTAIKIVGSIPPDLIHQVNLRIKLHPKFQNRELYKVIDERLLDSIVPSESQLSSLLAESDVIVSLNYFGTALIHSIFIGKPVVYLWTDQCLGKTGDLENADLLLGAGELARNESEFWDVIRKVKTKSTYADQLKSKSSAFAEKNLMNFRYKDVVEFVDSLELRTLTSGD